MTANDSTFRSPIRSPSTRTTRLASAIVLAAFVLPTTLSRAQDAPAAAVSYTAEQAVRGQATYTRRCADCHGSTLDNGENGGAPLRGDYFRNHWGGGSIGALTAYAKARMPPDRPGGLSDQSYTDLVAYLLQANGYPPSDKELPGNIELQLSMSLKRIP